MLQQLVSQEKLQDFCQKWAIADLAVLGSISLEDFGPDSDVDILVTFRPDARWSLLDHLDITVELAEMLDCEVQLISRKAIERSKNPFPWREVLETAQPSNRRIRLRHMLSDDDVGALLDIYRAASRIVEFGLGYDKRAFLEDELTQSAVLYQLLIIGEAARRRFSGRLRYQCPNVRWYPMSNMPYSLTTVDLEQVWRTVTVDIPALIESLHPLLLENTKEKP